MTLHDISLLLTLSSQVRDGEIELACIVPHMSRAQSVEDTVGTEGMYDKMKAVGAYGKEWASTMGK